jgi:hypothetical protein
MLSGEGEVMKPEAALPVETLPPASPAPPARQPGRRFKFDKRFIAPLFITCILIVGQLTQGMLESHASPFLNWLTGGWITSYWPTFVAIAVAILAELFLGRLFFGKWLHLASAYVSGISVGILVRSPDLWPYVLCSLLSIVSKYALRVGNRHIWNPSNFGICALLLLAPTSMSVLSIQWSNELWPLIIIWCLGSLILLQVGRLHISVTYAVCFVLLALVRSAITGKDFVTTVAPITGPMYQLFIFFMITDPRTTTRSRWSQCLVVVIIAVVEAVLRLDQLVPLPFVEPKLRQNLAIYAPLYSLFVVGPIANLIEIWLDARKGRKAGPAAG